MEDRIITQIAPLPKPATFKDTTKTTMRVAAYARVSTDHEDQQSSLVAQTEYYKKLISEHPGWQFVQIYVDDGISGLRTEHREGFNRMVEDALSGDIDLVLTKSISRFARNTVDSVSTIRKLKEKGIAVYFEKENIYTMDSKGEFLLTIMSSLAQEESRSISENVTWGQRKRLADGKMSLAYSRFLGYDKGKEKYEMVVNDEQAAVVRRIFFMFLQGYTAHSMSKILTDKGIPSPCGCDVWYAKTIQSILQNEKYKGDALLQKEFTVDFLTRKMKRNEGEVPQYYVKEDHEPIISPWLFDYVQKRLKERGDVPGRYSGVTVLSSKVNRVLVVAPLSILGVWQEEFEKFAAFPYSLTILKGTVAKKKEQLTKLPTEGLQVVVINYESAWRLEKELLAYNADLVIADEAHKLKENRSKQSQGMHHIGDKARYKLLLTGTLITNRELDVFSQYRFLNPQVFGTSFYAFRNQYFEMGGYGNHTPIFRKWMTDDFLRKLHSVAYRVTKAECLDLPAKSVFALLIKSDSGRAFFVAKFYEEDEQCTRKIMNFLLMQSSFKRQRITDAQAHMRSEMILTSLKMFL